MVDYGIAENLTAIQLPYLIVHSNNKHTEHGDAMKPKCLAPNDRVSDKKKNIFRYEIHISISNAVCQSVRMWMCMECYIFSL